MNDLDNQMAAGLNRVWEYIGADTLSCLGVKRMRAEDVQDTVADYAGMYLDDEVFKSAWNTATFDQQSQWLAMAFPKGTRYGY